MASRPLAGCILGAAVSAVTVPAAAEPLREPVPVPAPRQALELTLSAGYIRTPTGYGGLSSRDAREGIGSEFGLSARTLHWSVGIVAQYAKLARERGDDLHTWKGGIAVAYHLLPDEGIDPWLGVTSGYRFVRAGASHHGFEVARITAGADLRASPLVAVGPLVSVGLDVLPWTASDDTRWYLAGLVGIQGRFDLSPAIVGD